MAHVISQRRACAVRPIRFVLLIALFMMMGAADRALAQFANPTAHDIVLHAADATIPSGSAWVRTADSSAASGFKMRDPNNGLAKVAAPLQSPTHYFEMTFSAHANVPYRIWLRFRCDNNDDANDSVYLQFTNTVNYAGSAIWRINSTSGIDAASCDWTDAHRAPSAWGWNDNGNGRTYIGQAVIFNTAGKQTIRVQRREDGVSIDQIVLSPDNASFFNKAPGAYRDDTRILQRQPGTAPTEVVLRPGDGTANEVGSQWAIYSDSSAAGGAKMRDANTGAARVNTALASPANYFEMTFTATAGIPYRLWMRMRADSDSNANDSVHVQFNNSVNASGSPIFRIGTTNSTVVALEAVYPEGVLGWGWTDDGVDIGGNLNSPPIYFSTTGTQTIRVQRREDGVAIDQIVLSAGAYLNNEPGILFNDTTIFAKSTGATSPPSNNDGDLDFLLWNIHRGDCTDGAADDFQRHASYIAINDVDICAMQEFPTKETLSSRGIR